MIAAFLAVVVATGCVLSPPKTRIGDIQRDPREFDGRMVTIAGEVVSSTNVIVLRYFKVRDDTGQIVVVTNRAVPKRGAKVSVRGRVRQAFEIDDESLVVLIEEPPDENENDEDANEDREERRGRI